MLSELDSYSRTHYTVAAVLPDGCFSVFACTNTHSSKNTYIRPDFEPGADVVIEDESQLRLVEICLFFSILFQVLLCANIELITDIGTYVEMSGYVITVFLEHVHSQTV